MGAPLAAITAKRLPIVIGSHQRRHEVAYHDCARIVSRQRCRPGPCARAIVPPRRKRPCVNHPCGALNRGEPSAETGSNCSSVLLRAQQTGATRGGGAPYLALRATPIFPMRPSPGVLHLKCKNDLSPFRATPFQGTSTGRYRPGGALSALFERSSGICDRQAARRRSRARLDRVF